MSFAYLLRDCGANWPEMRPTHFTLLTQFPSYMTIYMIMHMLTNVPVHNPYYLILHTIYIGECHFLISFEIVVLIWRVLLVVLFRTIISILSYCGYVKYLHKLRITALSIHQFGLIIYFILLCVSVKFISIIRLNCESWKIE